LSGQFELRLRRPHFPPVRAAALEHAAGKNLLLASPELVDLLEQLV
jgi:hypothetical protein